MELEGKYLEFWNQYSKELEIDESNIVIEAGMAGNEKIADELLDLYLCGKKTAGCGLVKDYEIAGDDLPKIGNYWIILDSLQNPRCIVKTIKIDFFKFSEVTQEIVNAEGEGDLSIEYWRKGHIEFFTPFLKEWGVENLDEEMVVVEYYELVYK